jgi:hypothetical protein
MRPMPLSFHKSYFRTKFTVLLKNTIMAYFCYAWSPKDICILSLKNTLLLLCAYYINCVARQTNKHEETQTHSMPISPVLLPLCNPVLLFFYGDSIFKSYIRCPFVATIPHRYRTPLEQDVFLLFFFVLLACDGSTASLSHFLVLL